MNYRILLVDDEPDILEFVGYNLTKEGYEVFTATNGNDAIQRALQVYPHLILLDVMMPGMDGHETCRKMRAMDELQAPVIAFLTARGEDEAQIDGFDAGADDYIAKPIRVNVLVSRIKALLKRFDAPVVDMVDKRSLIMNHERYVVIKDGQTIMLPRKEFRLLALLYSRPEKVFTREEIYANIWGDEVIVGDRTIDVHIRKLREKIGDNHIVTIKGVGYKYSEELESV